MGKAAEWGLAAALPRWRQSALVVDEGHAVVRRQGGQGRIVSGGRAARAAISSTAPTPIGGLVLVHGTSARARDELELTLRRHGCYQVF
jgi:hypothetical protein